MDVQRAGSGGPARVGSVQRSGQYPHMPDASDRNRDRSRANVRIALLLAAVAVAVYVGFIMLNAAGG